MLKRFKRTLVSKIGRKKPFFSETVRKEIGNQIKKSLLKAALPPQVRKTKLIRRWTSSKIHSKEVNTPQAELNGLQAKNKAELDNSQRVVREESKRGKCSIKVSKKMNPKWKFLVEELDSVGVVINKTLVNLVKMYSEEEVKSAISLIKIRKSEKHIPNLAGYFTAALKGNWAISNPVAANNPEEILKDTATHRGIL